jgi:photoactive yellow protein
MPDASDPDSSSDSSSSERDRPPYVQQWQALCEVLGTSDPNEVLARVQTLKRQMERPDAPDAEDADREGEGLVTISEVEGVFREMNEKIEKLRQRNADLAQKLEERDGEGQPQKIEQLLEALDATTMEEAEQRVRQLSERLEALYREKETLAQAGLPEAEDALEEIDRLRREREALRRERDDLQAERDELAEKLEAASDQPEDASSGASEGLPAEAADVLGIRSVEEAYELEALIEDLSERLDRLRHEHEELEAAGLSVETALTMIENMEAQLAALYHSDAEEGRSRSGRPPAGTALAALDDALRRRIEALTDTSPEAADDLTDLMRPLVDRLETLSDTHEALVEADLDGEKAVAIIESMEAQLNDLYRRIDEQGPAADRLDAIEEVLGISTRREAEELSELAQQMERQLTSLYEEKEMLRELGLSSIEDAVDMIESMEAQLDDLYEDKEALRDVELGSTEEQSTFQQLEALYAERQRLQEALGVSSADDVIEMVETLTSQLEDLYTGRDAAVDPEERHDAQLWAPDTGTVPNEPASDPEETESPLTIRSLEHQLEALYREKETLLREGLADAEEAVTRLRTQRRHIDRLQRENADYEQRFDRLASALGTEQVARIVELVRALESKADVTIEEVRPAPPDPAPESPAPDARLEATSPVVDDRTLARLDDMSDGELNALDVGAVGLRDDGTVATLNAPALRLPPLRAISDPDDVLGQHFFRDLAPSTNNALFAGRVRAGGRRGELDARFPYTFARTDAAPESFAVHLYRAPESDTTWLLFRPL